VHDSLGPKNEPQYSGAGVPADAADLTEVAAYAAKVGNRRSDLDSVRTGLTGADLWDGLQFYATDTGATWLYKGVSGSGSWVRRNVTMLGQNTIATQPVLPASPTWLDLCTVNATSTGGTVTVDWNAIYANEASGLNRTVDFQVVCDGTLVGQLLSYDAPLTPGATGYGASFSVSSTVAAGAHTWKLQGRASAATACGARFATIKVTEV
jgi:hypothetical protein